MEKLIEVYEDYGEDIVDSEYVVESEIVDELRWSFVVLTTLKIDDEYYQVDWLRAKTENGEDNRPTSANDFTRVYPSDTVVVKAVRSWVQDPSKVEPTEFEQMLRIISDEKVRKIVDKTTGVDEANKAVKSAREALEVLKPLAQDANLEHHAIAADEYMASLEKLLSLCE